MKNSQMSDNGREETLEEFIDGASLHKNHAVHMRLNALLEKEAHPLREFIRQLKFKFRR